MLIAMVLDKPLSNLGLPLSYAYALAHFRFIKNLDTKTYIYDIVHSSTTYIYVYIKKKNEHVNKKKSHH